MRRPDAFSGHVSGPKTPIGLYLGQVALVVIGLGLVEWLVGSGRINRLYLATPSDMLGVLPDLIRDEALLRNIGLSLLEAVCGFVLSMGLGVVTGLLMGVSPQIRRFFSPFLAAFMSIPKVTLIPLLVLYVGIGFAHKVTIVVLYCYFGFVYNTVAGISQVNPNYIRVLRAFGASGLQIIMKVILPSAIPSIMAAVRLEASLSLVAVLYAEMVASNAGIGNLISRAEGVYDIPKTFCLVCIVTILSALIQSAVRLAESHVRQIWKQ